MPTENRSSNTEMVSFPRELSDELAELIATRARVCGGGAYDIWEAICAEFGQPAQQHQGGPAAYLCKSEGAKWLQYGSKVGDPWKPGEVEVTPLYTHADPAEVERLRTELVEVQQKYCDELGKRLAGEVKLEAKLAEAHALRSFANEMISAAYEGGSFDGGDIQDMAVKHGLLRIESRAEECGEACACREYGFPAECYRKTAMLSASAEPSAPVEIDERAEFEAFFNDKGKSLPLLRGATTLRYPGGQYVSDWALFGLIVWQARAALERKP